MVIDDGWKGLFGLTFSFSNIISDTYIREWMNPILIAQIVIKINKTSTQKLPPWTPSLSPQFHSWRFCPPLPPSITFSLSMVKAPGPLPNHPLSYLIASSISVFNTFNPYNPDDVTITSWNKLAWGVVDVNLPSWKKLVELWGDSNLPSWEF